MDKEKLLSSMAYRMFVEELDKHLQSATETFANVTSSGSTALTIEQRSKLSTAFHTIRGGAGFFALSDIATLAKKLEEQLLLAPSPGNDDTGEVKALVDQLNRLAQSLPR